MRFGWPRLVNLGAASSDFGIYRAALEARSEEWRLNVSGKSTRNLSVLLPFAWTITIWSLRNSFFLGPPVVSPADVVALLLWGREFGFVRRGRLRPHRWLRCGVPGDSGCRVALGDRWRRGVKRGRPHPCCSPRCGILLGVKWGRWVTGP